MTLELNIEDLPSRAVRASVSQGGVRRFATNGIAEEDNEGLTVRLWNGFTRFGGFLISRTLSILGAGLKFSISLLVGLGVQTFQYIWNFNWNADDSETLAGLKSSFDAMGSTVGGTVGNALGSLFCGALPGAVIAMFNEPLAMYVLENIGEEALDEIAGNLANVIRQSAALLVKGSIAFLFSSARKLYAGTSSLLLTRLVEAGLIDQQKITDTVKAKKKPWSFATGTQNFVESLPDGFIQNFVEEGIEEFSDACIESFYLIGSGTDAFFSAAKLANANILGAEQTIEIQLNRAIDEPLPA